MVSILFFFYSSVANPNLPSFPTRRSSDLLQIAMHDARLVRRLKPATNLAREPERTRDRKSTRLNSSHVAISYAVFCLKKKNPRASKSRQEDKHSRVDQRQCKTPNEQ